MISRLTNSLGAPGIYAAVLLLVLLFNVTRSEARVINVTALTVDYPTYQSSGKFAGTWQFIQNGQCTLLEAIVAANSDQITGDCPRGTESDIIELPAGNYVLSPPSAMPLYDYRIFPQINTNITITGLGTASTPETTIRRNTGALRTFGFFKIAASGNLTINNIELRTASSYNEDGGTIRNEGGLLTLNNVKIKNGGISTSVVDTSSLFGSSQVAESSYRGGAVANLSGGTTTINNSLIESNTNSAIFNSGSSGIGAAAIYSHVILNGTSLTDNTATPVSSSIGGKGGAIHNLAQLTISNSFITNNSAQPPDSESMGVICTSSGGGIYDARTVPLVTISNSTLSGNQSRCGGGMHLNAQNYLSMMTAQQTYSNTTIDHTSVYNNTAAFGYGGGIWHESGYLVVTDTSIINNQATRSEGFFGLQRGTGGGIFKSASNQAPAARPTALVNVTLKGNSSAGQGGGLWISPMDNNGGVTIKNTIIEGNGLIGENGAPQNDCYGTITSAGYNIISPFVDTNVCLVLPQSTDRTLQPSWRGIIAFSQIPAGFYYLPATNSPTKNAGTNSGASATDQVSMNRLGVRDIGSIEDTCGDGTQAQHEICDDGNDDNTDDCTSSCLPATCGDGFIQPANNEICDDGNTTVGDGCNDQCETEFCGDGFVQAGRNEECDDSNQTPGDGCSATCQTESICGDNMVEDPENCDDGNTANGDGCSAGCLDEICGDGVLQESLGEECDDGNNNEDDTCTSSCERILCGNATLDAGEQCDDGNRIPDDGCGNTCQIEICGDEAIQRSRGEQCDDGNTTANDGCSSTCRREICSDGIVQRALGEFCDDGNRSNNDDCVLGCNLAACGDGYLRSESRQPEECDDSNRQSGDGCSETCALESGASTTPQATESTGETLTTEPITVEPQLELTDENLGSTVGSMSQSGSEKPGTSALPVSEVPASEETPVSTTSPAEKTDPETPIPQLDPQQQEEPETSLVDQLLAAISSQSEPAPTQPDPNLPTVTNAEKTAPIQDPSPKTSTNPDFTSNSLNLDSETNPVDLPSEPPVTTVPLIADPDPVQIITGTIPQPDANVNPDFDVDAISPVTKLTADADVTPIVADTNPVATPTPATISGTTIDPPALASALPPGSVYLDPNTDLPVAVADDGSIVPFDGPADGIQTLAEITATTQSQPSAVTSPAQLQNAIPQTNANVALGTNEAPQISANAQTLSATPTISQKTSTGLNENITSSAPKTAPTAQTNSNITTIIPTVTSLSSPAIAKPDEQTASTSPELVTPSENTVESKQVPPQEQTASASEFFEPNVTLSETPEPSATTSSTDTTTSSSVSQPVSPPTPPVQPLENSTPPAGGGAKGGCSLNRQPTLSNQSFILTPFLVVAAFLVALRIFLKTGEACIHRNTKSSD